MASKWNKREKMKAKIYGMSEMKYGRSGWMEKCIKLKTFLFEFLMELFWGYLLIFWLFLWDF
jgi:hypothetical protein